MDVKVLGTGCSKCQTLEDRVKKVAQTNNIKISFEKVSDINEILDYNIMMTPGLVVNGAVKSSGKLPSEDQILEWLRC